MGKLLDYLIDIQKAEEKKIKPTMVEMSLFSPVLTCEAIEAVKDHLLTLEDFNGVKKINVLKAPVYMGHKETLLPLDLDESNLGDTSDAKMVSLPNYLYSPGETDIEFAEEIDIYSIDLTPAIYDPTVLTRLKLGPGVWKMPPYYSPETFVPINEIRIIYSAEGLQDILIDKTPEEVQQILKDRIMNQVEKMLTTSSAPNVPAMRKIIFRMSPRSIKVKENSES
jgi:hypothetical protein